MTTKLEGYVVYCVTGATEYLEQLKTNLIKYLNIWVNNMSLYQKIRPKDLNGVVGNDTTISAIKSMLMLDDKPHAFIFKGPTGCGKTTTARILASKLGCSQDNILEYNAANTRGIDTIREIVSDSNIYGMGGGCKTYLIDECHQLTKDSQEAILKILEDYPKHTYFILCTTEPNNLIKTVRNRCTEYELNPLSEAEIKLVLANACKQENLTIDQDLIDAIAKLCEGSPRNALVSLEQIVGIQDVDKALELIVRGTIQDASVLDLCKLLSQGQKLRFDGWQKILRTFDSIKAEPEVIRKSILTYTFNKLVRCENTGDAMDYAHLLRELSPSTFYGGKSMLGAMIAKFVLGG